MGDETNLCHNAVDRHLATRGSHPALVAISSETRITREYTYRELHCEVNAFTVVMKKLDAGRGASFQDAYRQRVAQGRPGKLLQRSLQALAGHRDPGDLSTLDDPEGS